jgi:hypothetical protein
LHDILGDIDHDELNQIFRAWLQRVQEINQSIGGYLR